MHQPQTPTPPTPRDPVDEDDKAPPSPSLPTRSRELESWGRTHAARSHVIRPEKEKTAIAAIHDPPTSTIIPRGNGRSYGDAALNQGGAVTSMRRLDRMLAFDPATGLVTCETGVTLGDILDHALPKGYTLPVLPGTRHVTVGGAIAANIHGKTHAHQGAFASIVRSFRLATPTGAVLVCSRHRNPDIFWATLGGMGLTGTILTASLKLTPVETAYMMCTRKRTRTLEETLDTLIDEAAKHPSTVAWVDASKRADAFGRGIVTTGHPATEQDLPGDEANPLERAPRFSPTLPFTLPSSFINRVTSAAFNSLYYWTHPEQGPRAIDLGRHFFPLDAIDQWNRAYGPQGLLQYQTVIPQPEARKGVQTMLQRIKESSVPPTLTVLKVLGSEDEALLSFPKPGVTLAVDMPARPDAYGLLEALDEVCLEHGGRVYLAKDARLSPATFEQMYPAADRFRRIKNHVDPEMKVSSPLARRLGLAEAPRGDPS